MKASSPALWTCKGAWSSSRGSRSHLRMTNPAMRRIVDGSRPQQMPAEARGNHPRTKHAGEEPVRLDPWLGLLRVPRAAGVTRPAAADRDGRGVPGGEHG